MTTLLYLAVVHGAHLSPSSFKMGNHTASLSWNHAESALILLTLRLAAG